MHYINIKSHLIPHVLVCWFMDGQGRDCEDCRGIGGGNLLDHLTESFPAFLNILSDIWVVRTNSYL